MKLPTEFKILSVRECPVASPVIDAPDLAVDYWRRHVVSASWFDPSKEAVVVLVLDTKRRLIGHNLVALGTLDSCPVDCRGVFRPIIGIAGSAAILMHNHPSGDATPSAMDIRITRELVRAGQLLRIPILDHVIVGDACHVSLRELGYVND